MIVSLTHMSQLIIDVEQLCEFATITHGFRISHLLSTKLPWQYKDSMPNLSPGCIVFRAIRQFPSKFKQVHRPFGYPVTGATMADSTASTSASIMHTAQRYYITKDRLSSVGYNLIHKTFLWFVWLMAEITYRRSTELNVWYVSRQSSRVW